MVAYGRTKKATNISLTRIVTAFYLEKVEKVGRRIH